MGYCLMNVLKMSSQMILSAEGLVASGAAWIRTKDARYRNTHLKCMRLVMDLVVSSEVPFPSKTSSTLNTNFRLLDFSHFSTIPFGQCEFSMRYGRDALQITRTGPFCTAGVGPGRSWVLSARCGTKTINWWCCGRVRKALKQARSVNFD
jgi:hypothetical protein